MAEELEEQPDDGQDNINKAEKRIKDSVEKARVAMNERDEFAKARETAEAEKAAALKEVEFYKGFTTQASKYSAATEFQDKIREKVMAGYDIEDATVSVLAKEGRLTSGSQPTVRQPSPAGGSATTTVRSSDKPMNEMTKDEKRQALMEAESRGDISLT